MITQLSRGHKAGRKIKGLDNMVARAPYQPTVAQAAKRSVTTDHCRPL
jgi:hypothetical protein